jgi:hypothetical protein
LGAIGCGTIYYHLRTGKQYVEVYYFAHTQQMGEFLMQFEEEEMKTFETIYHY